MATAVRPLNQQEQRDNKMRNIRFCVLTWAQSNLIFLLFSTYFDRDDVALRQFAEFFMEQSHEEWEHAEKLMAFQNKRGGRVLLQDIQIRFRDEWGSGLEAMQRALQMEKDVNQSLLDLHKLTSYHINPHLCDFLERHYLDEQVKMIKKLGDHITNLKRLGAPDNGMGEYLFDRLTLSPVGFVHFMPEMDNLYE
ncbi:ferritin heavy chain-like [Stegostoma tigrinum]|uniref:ferritin heavy chain-like n=1 Tax=Stegostoma tigrinum TaxID=3053191 RepID=UPI00287031BF|nr:ferritin heavy chain-like [Stegostoma tigrinum]